MTSKTYEVGQRIVSPYGKATITGFERFDSKGCSIEPAEVDDGDRTSRVIVKLDPDHTWPGDGDIIYLFRNDRDIKTA